jgi:hypothetical protein
MYKDLRCEETLYVIDDEDEFARWHDQHDLAAQEERGESSTFLCAGAPQRFRPDGNLVDLHCLEVILPLSLHERAGLNIDIYAYSG